MLLSPAQKALLQPTWAACPGLTKPRVSAQKGYVDAMVPLPGLVARDIDVECDGARVTVRAGDRDVFGRRSDVVAAVKLPCPATGQPRWVLRQGLLCVRLGREAVPELPPQTLADRMRERWTAFTAGFSRALAACRLRFQQP